MFWKSGRTIYDRNGALSKNVIIKVFCFWSCFFLFIVRNSAFFMGIIFCSSFALIWTFNAKGVYNCITKEVNISVNLVPFFNDVSFLFCRFLKSGVMNELKSIFLWKRKKVIVIYSKQGKTLLFTKCYFGQHMHGGPL